MRTLICEMPNGKRQIVKPPYTDTFLVAVADLLEHWPSWSAVVAVSNDGEAYRWTLAPIGTALVTDTAPDTRRLVIGPTFSPNDG